MIEILLTIIILALLGYHAWYVEQVRKEKDRLINAILAKNANEMRDLDLAGNTKIEVEPTKPPDLQPMETLSDEEHLKAITNQLNEALGEEDGRR